MKLLNILESINQIEKTPFLKILDKICSDKKEQNTEILQIYNREPQIKNIENSDINRLFSLLKGDYKNHLSNKIKYSGYQIDILSDILIRDGNTVMSREWLLKLYEEELKKLKEEIEYFKSILDNGSDDIDNNRIRDYKIYYNCVKTGYENDKLANRDKYLSWEEKSVLNTLALSLGLSNAEVREINYNVIEIEKLDIDKIIEQLRQSGIVFINRKDNLIFIPDEFVLLLREINSIELSNKYIRRILRHLTESEINLISRKHKINMKLSNDEKIQKIIVQGINVFNLLSQDIFRENISKLDRGNRIQKLIAENMQIELEKYGRSLEDKISNLIKYFNDLEIDESISLTKDGFQKLLDDMAKDVEDLNKRIKIEFQIQEENVLTVQSMSRYNIKPKDVLYLLKKEELREFCNVNNIKQRGNLLDNIIDSYRNIDDLLIENYQYLGERDSNHLADQGINVKGADIGIVFENTTKKLFQKLGLNVDEKLKSKICKKQRIDIVLNLGNNELIVVECKTKKDIDYNNYTSIYRQLKSYEKLCTDKNFRVSQSLIVAPDYSEEFINSCDYEPGLNISLVTPTGLLKIVEGFINAKLKEFPINLFMKKGLLDADRIVKVFNR